MSKVHSFVITVLIGAAIFIVGWGASHNKFNKEIILTSDEILVGLELCFMNDGIGSIIMKNDAKVAVCKNGGIFMIPKETVKDDSVKT